MKKKKGILVGITILVLIILLIGFFFFFQKEETLSHFFHPEEPLPEEKEEILDNLNGVYAYEENLGKSYNIYIGCVVSKVSQYILVIDNAYEVYRSTCMGTYLLNEGRVDSLDVSYDEEKKQYKIQYNDLEYIKKDQVYEIVTNNQIENKLESIYLDSYQFILKETQFFGNYYSIQKKKIANTNGNYLMNIYPQGSSFFIQIYEENRLNQALYSTQAIHQNQLPIFTTFFDKIVILENNSFNQKIQYNLLTISTVGETYNLKNKFPITVDGVLLSTDNPILVVYNGVEKSYHMYVGVDSSFCATNENSVSYYEFKIDFNYSTKNLDDPVYLRTLKGSSGCSKMKELLEG